MKSKDEVILRMCFLATKVGKEMYHDDMTHDCFCYHGDDNKSHFEFNEIIIKFIEDAVDERLKKEAMY